MFVSDKENTKLLNLDLAYMVRIDRISEGGKDIYEVNAYFPAGYYGADRMHPLQIRLAKCDKFEEAQDYLRWLTGSGGVKR